MNIRRGWLLTRIERLQWYKSVLGQAADKSAEHLRVARRKLALGDLFFLLVVVLKRKDANKDFVYDRCNELQREPNGYLDLWSRESYKSTCQSFAKTIQDVLADPEITISIFSHTRPNAKKFLQQIKREFEINTTLFELFPDVTWVNPEKESPKWSLDEGLVFKRLGNPKESTVEAHGLVEGAPTGRHFQLMVYDDVIDQASVTNPDMIQKVTQAWELSLSLGKVGGHVRYVGTRYHFADPYKTILDRKAAIPRLYPCTVEGTWPGTPVLMTFDELAKRRQQMGEMTFAAQYLQNPSADRSMGFRSEWLRYYTPGSAENMNIYILGDPANEKKRGSDYTAFIVIGLGPDENYYILDMVRDRLGLKERGDALFSLHRRWKPKGVGYEKYGIQSDIQYFEIRMAEDNYRFNITALGGTTGKLDRIRQLAPFFEAGRIWLPDSCFKTDYEGRSVDLVTNFVEDEYKLFPVPYHDDQLDAMARILDPDLHAIWPKSKPEVDRYSRPKSRPRRAASAWSA